MTSRYLFEVFDEIRDANGDKEIIKDIIIANKSKSLLLYLSANYSPDLQCKFADDTIPDYNPDDSPLGMSFTTMMGETRKLPYFFKNGMECSDEDMNRMYINICEGLYPKEAELFTDILLQRLYIKGLDYEVINEAFGEMVIQPPIEKKEFAQNA